MQPRYASRISLGLGRSAGLVLKAFQDCLVLSRECGMDYGDYYWGLYRGYDRDPFPHSLLRTRQKRIQGREGFGAHTRTTVSTRTLAQCSDIGLGFVFERPFSVSQDPEREISLGVWLSFLSAPP